MKTILTLLQTTMTAPHVLPAAKCCNGLDLLEIRNGHNQKFMKSTPNYKVSFNHF